MNWPNLALMKAQQAPTTWSGLDRQTSRLSPVQTASMNAHCTSDGRNVTISASMATVTAALSGEENRCVRTQPGRPPRAGGGGSGGRKSLRTKTVSVSMRRTVMVVLPQRSTKATRALNQFIRAAVARLMIRYTVMVMPITSMARPEMLSVDPANTATRSG